MHPTDRNSETARKYDPDPPEPRDTEAEERIQNIEGFNRRNVEGDHEAIVMALCEIARQLARIADLHEFEMELSEDDYEEDDEDEEETAAETAEP